MTSTTIELSVGPIRGTTFGLARLPQAERHADGRVKANPSNWKAKVNVMYATRVVGYPPVELPIRRTILSERPYTPLVKQIEPGSGQ